MQQDKTTDSSGHKHFWVLAAHLTTVSLHIGFTNHIIRTTLHTLLCDMAIVQDIKTFQNLFSVFKRS